MTAAVATNFDQLVEAKPSNEVFRSASKPGTAGSDSSMFI